MRFLVVLCISAWSLFVSDVCATESVVPIMSGLEGEGEGDSAHGSAALEVEQFFSVVRSATARPPSPLPSPSPLAPVEPSLEPPEPPQPHPGFVPFTSQEVEMVGADVGTVGTAPSVSAPTISIVAASTSRGKRQRREGKGPSARLVKPLYAPHADDPQRLAVSEAGRITCRLVAIALNLKMCVDPVAQLAEHLLLKEMVLGSSPSGIINASVLYCIFHRHLYCIVFFTDTSQVLTVSHECSHDC